MYRAVSLFSGAGGMDLGFKWAGFKILFANDLKEDAVRTYSRNIGLKVVSCGRGAVEASEEGVYLCDVEMIDFAPVAGKEVDVVIGGPPCQDFSVVRGPDLRESGLHVRRGSLYLQFVRALAVVQPKVFVFENVPGLKGLHGGTVFRTILEDLARLRTRWEELRKLARGGNGRRPLGYEILFADVIDFATFGVPQNRKRLIVIGVRRDLVSNFTMLAEVQARLEARLKNGFLSAYPLTAMEAFEGKKLDQLEEPYRLVVSEWEGVWDEVDTLRARWWRDAVWPLFNRNVVSAYLAFNKVDGRGLEEALKQHQVVLNMLGYTVSVEKVKPSDGTNELPRVSDDVALRMRLIPPGENYRFLEGTRWAVKGRGISIIYRRLHPLRPAYTVVAYGGGGTYGYHYRRTRNALTLRELARLQTFPDSFLFYGTRSQIRAQIGEAVPPLAAYAVAEAVKDILDRMPA